MNINFEYYKIFYYVAKYHNFTKCIYEIIVYMTAVADGTIAAIRASK